MTESSEERDEFLQIYLEESNEELEVLVKLLLQLEEDPEDMESLREAFRLLHTFKGSTGMMGFERINALAHELETRFDNCRSGREQMTTETVSVALRCVDFFRDFMGRLEEGNEDEGDPVELIEAMSNIVATPVRGSSEPATPTESPEERREAVEKAAEETLRREEEEEARQKQQEEQQQAEEAQSQPEPAQESDASPSEDAANDPEPAAVDSEATSSQPDSTPTEATASSESAQPDAAELDPIVSGTSESGPVRERTLAITLAEEVELPDLKARLIIARLQAQGDILSTSPAVDDLDEAEKPITFRVRLRTAADDKELTSSIDIEGVSGASVESGDEQAAAAPEPAAEEPAKEDTAEEAAPAEQPAAPEKPAKQPATQAKSASRGSSARSGETIRVGIDRLDRLMNLAGELVVTNARFDQLADEMRLLFRSGGSIDAGSPLAESLLEAMSGHGMAGSQEDGHAGQQRIPGIVGNDGGAEDGAALRRGWMDRGRRVAGQVSETVDQLARLSRSIQQAVLETRMVPIGPMFNRFRRTVRDIAVKTKKQVALELEGEMTELDKRMVDELGDPMIHLIRNSLDHGIELPDERRRQGKKPEGTIRLSAYHQSNHVVIEIADDGAGIDALKVRQRALERGLATESELNMMTDTQIYGYIWHAGFSTAEQVSDISGRGVGMDVVRDRIASLGGVVELSSRPGQGSTVSIRLPLTLAIVNAMIVRFRGFRLAIPVTDVFEIYGLSRSEIFESQGREMIDVRGKLLPLYGLDELFAWNDYLPREPKSRNSLVQAVLVRHGPRCLAIEVDDLDGNSDIVIKSLNEHFSHIPGLGGACVMGDGEVCLVLDTASLELGNAIKSTSATLDTTP